ncbi:membrane protein [Brucella endophytica]|uniref:Membrane protein n=1 Tax=Brucella endophytica TaxID=1963359 RepID=A0A916SG45_9HYPH|nr:NfeD family protein [Brucella endophytica]GGA98492.1 membrane protein [Brucella endophytica]
MIVEFLTNLGIWNWLVLGLVLLMLEILAPGIFFIWFGLAALVTGALAFLLASSAAGFGWQLQTVVFLVLAVLFALAGRRFFGSRSDDSDDPLLNRRGQQLVGQRATLTEPIVNGRGRIRMNDTMWRVKGPDLPAGTEVRVVGFDPVSLEMDVEGIRE